MTDQAAFDHHMMGVSLAMARRGLGLTAPNPSVGAVIVDPMTGEVIARGTTAAGGRPHAEPVAIARAGARARGATLYVTLEPCSHQGHTPPCADGAIAAGIARVVCAIEDPDPRVAGRGLDKLRKAGIAVTRGVRAAEAHWVTLGHIARVSERRPFVQLKLALGPDGAVPLGGGGKPVFVTSAEARGLGHLLRAQADAILVGRGTVEADDPDLTCRLPGLAGRSPMRVVLARHGLDLAGTKLAARADRVPLVVVTGPDVRMETQGARVWPSLVVGGALWLPAVLEKLAAEGVTRLLVEGGPAIWRAFAQAGLVDEVVLFAAGGEGQPLVLARRHLGALPLRVQDGRRIGPDQVWRLVCEQRVAKGQVPWSPLL
ncbi:MAG: bifunctional diaminohydroxyphosphoribosylaminopyrimidine deaminase/5-amino-6-(5-phosphoribosylamino)uracil reductase RibD [Hyphomicrobiaceae bacterium]